MTNLRRIYCTAIDALCTSSPITVISDSSPPAESGQAKIPSPAVITGTERIASRIVPNSALNDVLKSDGGLLSLPAGRGRRFTFEPSMADNELRQKLQTNPPKKH